MVQLQSQKIQFDGTVGKHITFWESQPLACVGYRTHFASFLLDKTVPNLQNSHPVQVWMVM